jgi:hypothetical protein
MNAGMKDMLNIGGKFLAIGWPLQDVIAAMTWHPAHEVKQDQLGNLSEGAIADVAVISMEHGHFGFGDSYNARVESDRKMVCELTIKDGKFVYDLNAIRATRGTSRPPPPIDRPVAGRRSRPRASASRTGSRAKASRCNMTGGPTLCRQTNCRRCSPVRRTQSTHSG